MNEMWPRRCSLATNTAQLVRIIFRFPKEPVKGANQGGVGSSRALVGYARAAAVGMATTGVRCRLA